MSWQVLVTQYSKHDVYLKDEFKNDGDLLALIWFHRHILALKFNNTQRLRSELARKKLSQWLIDVIVYFIFETLPYLILLVLW